MAHLVRVVAAAVIAAFLLVGCASSPSVPASGNTAASAPAQKTTISMLSQGQDLPLNAETEYLRTIASSIAFGGRVRQIFYSLNLEVRKPLPENAVAVVRFENPDPGAAPVEAVYEPKPGETTFIVFSPGVECIVNNRLYYAVVTLFSDRTRHSVLSTHKQTIAFSVPASILKTWEARECDS